MLICNPHEIVIQGLTSNGKTFRPSDWSERLCGILSSFNQGHRLSYHQWVRPILIDNIRCVAVDKQLEQINEAMFHFLMDFAHDNDLRVLDCQSLLASQPDCTEIPLDSQVIQQSEKLTQANSVSDVDKGEVVQAATTNRSFDIREILENETTLAFSILVRRYPHIRDMQRFTNWMGQQRTEGYRLLGLFEHGKANAVAVCGFRILHNLAFGRYLYLDDLATGDGSVDQDVAVELLEELKRIAIELDCTAIHALAPVSIDNTPSHRLLIKAGFVLSHHYFSWDLT